MPGRGSARRLGAERGGPGGTGWGGVWQGDGMVTRVHAKENSPVEAGQLLLTLTVCHGVTLMHDRYISDA